MKNYITVTQVIGVYFFILGCLFTLVHLNQTVTNYLYAFLTFTLIACPGLLLAILGTVAKWWEPPKSTWDWSKLNKGKRDKYGTNKNKI